MGAQKEPVRLNSGVVHSQLDVLTGNVSGDHPAVIRITERKDQN